MYKYLTVQAIFKLISQTEIFYVNIEILYTILLISDVLKKNYDDNVLIYFANKCYPEVQIYAFNALWLFAILFYIMKSKLLIQFEFYYENFDLFPVW